MSLTRASDDSASHLNSVAPLNTSITTNSSTALTSYSGLGLNLPNIKLNANSDLQMTITPISTGSNDEGRYISWQWAQGSSPDIAYSTIGIDYFNSGTQHNFVWFVSNAVDMVPYSGATTCIKNPPSTNVDGSFNADCWITNQFNNKDSYQIRVSNNPALGPAWYQASIKDLTTGFHGIIGSINVGTQGFSSYLVNPIFQIYDRQQYASCSAVAPQDTFISDLYSNGRDLGSAKTIGYNVCVNFVVGSYKDYKETLIRFGGSNPQSRKVTLP